MGGWHRCCGSSATKMSSPLLPTPASSPITHLTAAGKPVGPITLPPMNSLDGKFIPLPPIRDGVYFNQIATNMFQQEPQQAPVYIPVGPSSYPQPPMHYVHRAVPMYQMRPLSPAPQQPQQPQQPPQQQALYAVPPPVQAVQPAMHPMQPPQQYRVMSPALSLNEILLRNRQQQHQANLQAQAQARQQQIQHHHPAVNGGPAAAPQSLHSLHAAHRGKYKLWSKEEDMMLWEYKGKLNLSWKEIALKFNDRTMHACQFRWKKIVAMRELELMEAQNTPQLKHF